MGLLTVLKGIAIAAGVGGVVGIGAAVAIHVRWRRSERRELPEAGKRRAKR